MYIVKSCTEFNILTGIPPCSEYPLGDCGRCPNWENAFQISDPETWCAYYLQLLASRRTKFHVLNRIFPVAAACAVPTKNK